MYLQPVIDPASARDDNHRSWSTTFDGLFVCTVELLRRLDRDPFDKILLFRNGRAWSCVTVRRTERWTNDGHEPSGGRALLQVEHFDGVGLLAVAVRARYGESGWVEVLDRGHVGDIDLFRLWAPMHLERDLERSAFHRPDLVEAVAGLSRSEADLLRAEIAHHLEMVGFTVISVPAPRRPTADDENRLVAHAVIRRFGLEVVADVRIDRLGEAYPRLVEPGGHPGHVVREHGDDDE